MNAITNTVAGIAITAALTPVAAARRIACLANTSLLVLEMCNDGSSSRWSRQFESLPPDVVNMIEEPATLEFASRGDAVKAFDALIDDCVNNDTGMITGSITLVTPHGAPVKWDLSDRTRPEFDALDAHTGVKPIHERL